MCILCRSLSAIALPIGTLNHKDMEVGLRRRHRNQKHVLIKCCYGIWAFGLLRFKGICMPSYATATFPSVNCN